MIPSVHSFKLDALRIILCACVLLCHFYPGYHVLAGNVGVLGFFVLSGYLLQASFFRMGASFDVEKFYASKAKRLLPAYLFALVVALIPLSLSSSIEFSIPSIYEPVASVFGYTFFLNYPSWFMSILFVFMLMAPLFWCLHRTRWGITMLFFLALAFSSFLYWKFHGANEATMAYIKANSIATQPQVRLWQFLAGMLICRVGQASVKKWSPLLRLSFSSVLCLLLLGLSCWVSLCYSQGKDVLNSFWFDATVVVFMAMLVLSWDDGVKISSPHMNRLISWVASLTYGVYLLHIPVQSIIRWGIGFLLGAQLPYWPHLCLTLAVTVLVADLFNRFCSWCWLRRG